jgi:FkbM family methyltransferase
MGLLMYRLTGDPSHHPNADTDNAYLPPDLPGFDRPITFVDAGAYTGDSCAHLLSRGVEVSRYVAFEPDRLNFERLGAFVRSSPIRDATLLPCGLSDRLRTVRLEGEGVSCRLVEAGAEDGPSVLCLALDAILPALAPDFVKMDIEGGEMAALNGMTDAIERGRPRLAISIYHRPEDLWDIPRWVAGHYDRLHIRQHGAHGFDTVLYAFPGAS